MVTPREKVTCDLVFLESIPSAMNFERHVDLALPFQWFDRAFEEFVERGARRGREASLREAEPTGCKCNITMPVCPHVAEFQLLTSCVQFIVGIALLSFTYVQYYHIEYSTGRL